MSAFDDEVRQTQEWFDSPRFENLVRVYSARQVVEQRGSIETDSTVARTAADAFYRRLRELFTQRGSITTFGPYSPGQAVTMKRMGIEGIYLGGWATSAKGSIHEDPGPDLASYPLSQVPDEAAVIVRALLTADRNQRYQRSRLSPEKRAAAPEHDFRPFLICDADTGHGGDPHVRNLVRRFVEAGIPGYHIEDQRPGTKKCGHQGGKVLVAVDEQIKRLVSARFQLDVMNVAGILVSRTDAEAATLIESRGDERDHPFLLGATNPDVPPFRIVWLAMLATFHERGVRELNGHLIYSISDEEYAPARAWLDRAGITARIEERAHAMRSDGKPSAEAAFEEIGDEVAKRWEAEAGIKTYGEAVADVLQLVVDDGAEPPISPDEWSDFARAASYPRAHDRARTLGLVVPWDCELARTPEGYYQVRGGVEYAIAKSLAVAPFADILWMETKTADLKDAKAFADAIHARFPEMMLAYNLSPSFSWDTTGMSDEEMRRFPEELGKLGYVFNFITYGGHQIDGIAGEDFVLALKQDGMLALAKLQRKIRLVESPYKTPQTLVGGPRSDAALAASSGRTAMTKAMGKGSTQHQHLVQTEVPTKLLEEWLAIWREHYDLKPKLKVRLRPHRAGSELLELGIHDGANEKLANVIFAPIQDRLGSTILSVRDQNTFEHSLRKKRLMSLIHLYLVHRYKASSVHYVSPSEDNQYQTQKMQAHGIFDGVHNEVGQIIVAGVNGPRVAALLQPDREALRRLIRKEA